MEKVKKEKSYLSKVCDQFRELGASKEVIEYAVTNIKLSYKNGIIAGKEAKKEEEI